MKPGVVTCGEPKQKKAPCEIAIKHCKHKWLISVPEPFIKHLGLKSFETNS